MGFSFNMKKTEIILKIIDNDIVDFLKNILEVNKVNHDDLQRFIQHSISRDFSRKCLYYLLPFFSRFQMFLFYQKKRQKPLCKDILRHIYSFYGNNKIILSERAYTNFDVYTHFCLGILYFYDIKLTRKILEKSRFTNQKPILICYLHTHKYKKFPLINAILTRIEKGIDMEENKKILELFKKNNIDIPKEYEKLPDMCSRVKHHSIKSLRYLQFIEIKN